MKATIKSRADGLIEIQAAGQTVLVGKNAAGSLWDVLIEAENRGAWQRRVEREMHAAQNSYDQTAASAKNGGKDWLKRANSAIASLSRRKYLTRKPKTTEGNQGYVYKTTEWNAPKSRIANSVIRRSLNQIANRLRREAIASGWRARAIQAANCNGKRIKALEQRKAHGKESSRDG